MENHKTVPCYYAVEELIVPQSWLILTAQNGGLSCIPSRFLNGLHDLTRVMML